MLCFMFSSFFLEHIKMMYLFSGVSQNLEVSKNVYDLLLQQLSFTVSLIVVMKSFKLVTDYYQNLDNRIYQYLEILTKDPISNL